MYVFFDTETTGVPIAHSSAPEAVRQWPRLVQIAWAGYDEAGSRIAAEAHLVYPVDFAIPDGATKIHGISTARARVDGKPLGWVVERFLQAMVESGPMLVAHNMAFDRGVVAAEMYRLGYAKEDVEKRFYVTRPICLMRASTAFCGLPRRFGKPKYPSLTELYRKLFEEEPAKRHSATADVEATARCFFRLLALGVIR